MNTPNDAAMDRDAIERLLLAIAAQAPAPDAAARIKQRVLGRIAQAQRAGPMLDIRRDEGWRPFADKAEMKMLHDDGTTMTWLVRLQAGARLGGHEHAGTEECLVLEGDFWLNDVRYGPGDYQIAYAGSRHHEARSDGGCLVFVRSPSARDEAHA